MSRPTTKTASTKAHSSLDNQAAALRKAGTQTESLSEALAYKLLPLLALCEFATRAHDTLKAVDRAAATDQALAGRLDGVTPRWIDPLVSIGDVPEHIGQCLALARALCSDAADQAQAVAESVYAAGREVEARHE